ncbi:MAG: HNH endonuclease [Alphaproteobacteria bacterium]
MSRTNCVYCNKEITTRSREHVIQNALGGLYESEDICCPECNNYISRHIDVPFTTIFNPILGNIDNLGKTNNKNSTPIYTGTVSYQGAQYSASFKGGKITSCPDLSRKLRCDISKLPLDVVSYNFDLKNDSFQTGMAKIAFNYALDQGVDLDVLKHGLNVVKNGSDISKIEYNYPMIPFCPMNAVDMYLETGTPTELYHNMILFSQHNRLWCYIDLFNTFQYYVLLSDALPQGTQIYNSYMQTLQKLDRAEPDVEIFRPKDAMIYAAQYGVEPCMDAQEMQRRIRNAIARKSQKQSMQKIIGRKIECLSIDKVLCNLQSPSQFMQFARAMPLYFDEDDMLRQETFRIVTPNSDVTQIIPYPDAILSAFNSDKSALATYTTAKFNKLNNFLIKSK